ncbi:MAG: hypothetical protein DSY80_01955 [Desulfocapsa sp.]|nr:MAG: hypothetical protein DSY80_01955 [Desulfocapsa sp.]
MPCVVSLETPLLIIYSEGKYNGAADYEFMTDKQAIEFEVDLKNCHIAKPYGLTVVIDFNDDDFEEVNGYMNGYEAEVFVDDYIDAFSKETGWRFGEYERWERIRKYDLRCHRCQEVADAIANAGYCEPAVWNLIEDHEEYTREEKGCAPVKWLKDDCGVWQPRKVR